MKSLQTQINESLFAPGGIDKDTILDDVALDILKTYSYNKKEESNDSIWNSKTKIAPIISTPNGIVIRLTRKWCDTLYLTHIHSKKCPQFNICKVLGKSNTEGGNLYVEIKSSDIESLDGIFTPNCEFKDCIFSIVNCPNLRSLDGLPKKMNGSNICVDWVHSNIFGNSRAKDVYKDEEEFIEPYKKFIQSFPDCDDIIIHMNFEDMYPGMNKLTIGDKVFTKARAITKISKILDKEIGNKQNKPKTTFQGKFTESHSYVFIF